VAGVWKLSPQQRLGAEPLVRSQGSGEGETARYLKW